MVKIMRTNGKNYEEINDDDDDGDVEKGSEKNRKKYEWNNLVHYQNLKWIYSKQKKLKKELTNKIV